MTAIYDFSAAWSKLGFIFERLKRDTGPGVGVGIADICTNFTMFADQLPPQKRALLGVDESAERLVDVIARGLDLVDHMVAQAA